MHGEPDRFLKIIASLRGKISCKLRRENDQSNILLTSSLHDLGLAIISIHVGTNIAMDCSCMCCRQTRGFSTVSVGPIKGGGGGGGMFGKITALLD